MFAVRTLFAGLLTFAGASTVADAQSTQGETPSSILPRVSFGLLAARSTFQAPYDGNFQRDLTPTVAIRAFERLGSRFALGVGLQYVDQRVTGLGPILQYQLEYLEVPLTLTGVLGQVAGVQAEVHAGAVGGVPMRCRINSTVPGGQTAVIRCGDPPVEVASQRMEASLRGGVALRTRLGLTSLGLSGAIQYGLREVFGHARVTTLLLGVELGR